MTTTTVGGTTGRPGYGQPDYRHPGFPQQGYRRKRESWLGDLFDFD